jgi:hypothetical protein
MTRDTTLFLTTPHVTMLLLNVEFHVQKQTNTVGSKHCPSLFATDYRKKLRMRRKISCVHFYRRHRTGLWKRKIRKQPERLHFVGRIEVTGRLEGIFMYIYIGGGG